MATHHDLVKINFKICIGKYLVETLWNQLNLINTQKNIFNWYKLYFYLQILFMAPSLSSVNKYIQLYFIKKGYY